MPEWIWGLILVVAYIVLFTWVLPKAGVPT
jgi:hypothetical protein